MNLHDCGFCGAENRSYKRLKDHLRRCSAKHEAEVQPFREAEEADRRQERGIAYDLNSGGFTEEQSNTLARVLMELRGQ
jgi:hypothetical protein